jgi:DNA-binding MarR family transcriptional regulator
MKPTNNIGFLLQRLAFLLARVNDQVLQERLGIGFSQFKILMILQWKPNVQQKHIANQLGQTEASISRQIKLLEDKGMLTAEVNPSNKREHVTKLTGRGERTIEKAFEVLNNYHAPMFDQLSEKQRQQVVESLTVMHDYVCRTEKPGSEEIFS